MVHALRRVSFSTCLNELFGFAARDPGQPLDRQFCHVFKTKFVSLLYLHPTQKEMSQYQKINNIIYGARG